MLHGNEWRWLAYACVFLPVGPAVASTTLLTETFESYADDDALNDGWEPRDGSGGSPPSLGGSGAFLTSDAALFPGIEGQAAVHVGGSVNQSTLLTPADPLIPTTTQSVQIAGDVFITDANSRATVGLRNRTEVRNIIELGAWNQAADDPTNPVFSTFAHRLILFENPPINEQPNWRFFVLDPRLDRPDDGDAVVDFADIGPGWHRFSATITPDTVTVGLDLYRDGLDNGASIGAGRDVPGSDATATYSVDSRSGFDSLRFGFPSGVSAPTFAAFDNLVLGTVEVPEPAMGVMVAGGLLAIRRRCSPGTS